MRAARCRYSELTPEERRKARCRSYSNVLQKRGHLKPHLCRDCGEKKVQKHHPDYANPRRVIWLCVLCHKAEHRNLQMKHHRAAA